MADPCLILFVCTANICRSPAAEYIARHEIGERDFLFRSAGFLYNGRPITDKMAGVLDRQGIGDAKLHLSSMVDDETLDAADLVLTMEARHLRDLTIRNRALFAKTVPLREAADRLYRPMSYDEFLADLDGRQPSGYFDERWDVDDPYKRSMRHYRDAVGTITALVSDVFSNLKA